MYIQKKKQKIPDQVCTFGRKGALPVFRVVKRSWRDSETAEIRALYYVERYTTAKVLYFDTGVPVWKPVQIEHSNQGGSYKTDAYFRTEGAARDFMRNLLAPVPKDELITEA